MTTTNPVQYRLSKYTTAVRLHDGYLLANGPHLQRITVGLDLGNLCELLIAGPTTIDALSNAVPPSLNIENVISFLQERHFVVEASFSEETELKKAFHDEAVENPSSDLKPGNRWPPPMHYWSPALIESSTFDQNQVLKPLRILLIGGCMLQFAEETLIKSGMKRGFDIQLRHEWPPMSSNALERAKQWAPDISVLQPTVHPLMAGLWDLGVFVDADERTRRIAALKVSVKQLIDTTIKASSGRLVLVHNFAPPALSPFGRADSHTPVNFRFVVSELNHYVDELVCERQNVMVVDEERLACRFGVSNLFDDTIFPFGHHGGAPRPNAQSLSQSESLNVALTDEYINNYIANEGLGHVKCIVVDLDNTLWPGVVAEDGFGWIDDDDYERWRCLGLHQALAILKSRGILLAIASKGTPEATLEPWRSASHPLLLMPDDFVSIDISWRPKSEAIKTLCDQVGLAQENILFLDDNPVERSEVKAHLPNVQVLDEHTSNFRRYLLSSPTCDVLRVTHEARERTSTTKALLSRRGLEEGFEDQSFLAGLQINLEVQAARQENLARITELLNRTNQYSTTQLRAAESDVVQFLNDPDTQIFVMFTKDRFVDYGLTGVCIVTSGTIEALAVSCRVIGLDVGVTFLTTCVAAVRRHYPKVVGRLVRTSRNEPAQDVFVRAGFSLAGDDIFELDSEDVITDTPSYHTVEIDTHERTSSGF